VGQINKEEELFQWTPTTYPQLDTIETALEPYHKLFTTIFKWQKTEKRFMDGAFQELNAEDTQAEVSHRFASILLYVCSALSLQPYLASACTHI
jgi:dynein heavy chain